MLLGHSGFAQQPRLVVPVGHSRGTESINFNKDGTRFYTTAGIDNDFNVWDTNTGRLLANLPLVHNIHSFSLDGSKILTASSDSTLTVWDSQSGVKLFNIGFNNYYHDEAYFSPNNQFIFTYKAGNGINEYFSVYNSISGKLVNQIKISGLPWKSELAHTEFSADSRSILLSSHNVGVIKWDFVKNIKFEFSVYKEMNRVVKLSPDNSTLVTVSSQDSTENSKRIMVWNYEKGKFLKNIKLEHDFIILNFSPDSKTLVTISDKTENGKGLAQFWDINTGKELYSLKDPKTFVQRSSDKNIIEFIYEDHEKKDNIVYLEYSPNGKRFITSSGDGVVKLWGAFNGKLISNLSLPFDTIYRDTKTIKYKRSLISFSNDGSKIVTFTDDYPQIPEIWDVMSGNKIVSLKETSHYIDLSKFSPDDKHLLIIDNDNKSRLWSLQGQEILKNYQLGGYIKPNTDVSFSPNDNFVLTAVGNKMHIFDLYAGSLYKSFSGHDNFIYFASYSPDGEKIISTSVLGPVKTWDVNSGSLEHTLFDSESNVDYSEYSINQNYILTSNRDRKAVIWNTKTGKSIATCDLIGSFLKIQKSSSSNIKPSSNQKKTTTTESEQNLLSWWDWKIGKCITNLETFNSKPINEVAFKTENKKIFDSHGQFNSHINGLTRKLSDSLKFYSANTIVSAHISPDQKKMLIFSDNNPLILNIYNAKNNPIALVGHNSYCKYGEFNNDGSKVLTASEDHTSKIWDSNNGKLLGTLSGHSKGIFLAHFSNDEKKILTTSYDNTIRIWDAFTFKLISTFYLIDTTNYLCQISSGYYRASLNATKKLHYVSKNLKINTFEQLDVKYNRPDKVLQAIGNPDTSLIKSYKRAYEKRIEKLKIDTTAFNDSFTVPESDFANRDAKELNGKITLTFKGEDKNTKLDQYNVWVNEVPIFGLRGVNIRKQNTNTFETTITIPLSVGKNQIEMSIRNVNGIESYRSPLEVNYKPNVPPKEKVYFVGIGIDKFKDKTHNLLYCAKDIRVLTAEMKQKYGDDLVIMDTLINANVTVQNVKALKKRLLNTTVDDKVIVAYSGHGLLSAKKDYYLSTYSVNFNKPEENGLNYDDLESVIDSIPARKKLLLLDACHSGEVDKEDIKSEYKQPLIPKSTDAALPLAKAQQKNKKSGGEPEENLAMSGIGLRGSFELMQSLFVNVGKNTGATIFTAAAGKQVAYESDGLQHSIFTYYIIDALRNYKTLTVSKLKEIVAAKVATESKKSQIPTSRSETIAVDWVLW